MSTFYKYKGRTKTPAAAGDAERTSEKRNHNSSGVPGNEVVGASGSASEIQAGVKLSEDAPNYRGVTGENGIRCSFGLADTPKAACILIASDQKV